jgi:peroxiredoxin
MKNVLGLVLLAVLLGCTQPDGYKIEVSLVGGEGQLILEKRGETALVPLDTVELKNGKAILKGKVEYPDLYILHLAKNDQRTILFVENCVIKVTGTADSLQNAKISGSPVNDEFLTIKTKLDNDNKITMEKYREYQLAAQSGDTSKAGTLMEEVQKLSAATDQKVKDFVKNNPASWVTPLFLAQLMGSLPAEEMDTLVSALDPKLSVTPYVAEIKKQLDVQRKLAIGQVAPDFTQNDPDGKPVKLSDVYAASKYTLIDFWAAWCGPCRQENPNIVAVYKDFKNKGFTVFGVSLDQDRERWLKAISDDKLTWTQVSDLKYWQNEAAALYSVRSIPANMLIDQTGKIVEKNLRGEDLRKKLAELLP